MEKSIKILILEDSLDDVWFINRVLNDAEIKFSAVTVNTENDFRDAISNYSFDVILSDHSLPGFNSLQALKICKEYAINSPLLLVTGTVSEEFAAQCIKEGAYDYILKGNLTRLPSAISNAIDTKKTEKEKTKAIKDLIKSNKELNTFIYKATHDLRGPLSSIMGLTSLANTSENIDKDSYLKMIAECTHKLDAILLLLIDVMSIKDAEVVYAKIDFKSMVDAIINRLIHINGINRISFKVNIKHPEIFYSSEKILNLMLQNLIENAIKYHNYSISDPFVEINISGGINSGIKIEVRDNGVGMPDDVQKKVFEMFYRGHPDSKGSGLGLYIVKNGVDKLEGEIDIKSLEGTGTHLTIMLPNRKTLVESLN